MEVSKSGFSKAERRNWELVIVTTESGSCAERVKQLKCKYQKSMTNLKKHLVVCAFGIGMGFYLICGS